MSFALLVMRNQTLIREINKKTTQQDRLKESLDLIQKQSTNSNRLLKIYYALQNGIGAYTNADFNNEFASQMQDLEPLIELLDDKADAIELEISMNNSLLKAQEAEQKDLADKTIKETIKKEVPKYTM